MTPLHYCAANNSFDVAEVLLKNSVQINISDKFGNQPLWTAVFNSKGNYWLVVQLVNLGSDCDYKNISNKSPLDFAKQIQDIELIKLLKHSEI